MTIGELIDLIKDLPDDCPVGTTDHFGEFVEADKYFFEFRKSDWRNKFDFFKIESIDIGPEPD